VLVLLGSSFPGQPIQPIGPIQRVAAAPGADPSATPRTAPLDSRFVYPAATDPNGPRAGRERAAPPLAGLTGYVWPLKRGRITLPFKDIPGGTRIRDGKLMHDGFFMDTFRGDRVNAAHDGVVLAAGRRFDDFIGWVGDLGPYYRTLDRKKLWDDLPIVVIVDDGNGYRSVYAHFGKVTVRPGDRVKAGQRIGFEGATGHASGCHVHYGLFSPLETETWGGRKANHTPLRTPKLEIARVDPLLVLPFGQKALRTRHVPDVAKLLRAEAAQP
jgi:murein DD-endopeptidase MepM/ murein hydrolase activator NlpD